MSNVEHHKAVVRAYADAFGAGDFAAIRNLCTPDVVIQGDRVLHLRYRVRR